MCTYILLWICVYIMFIVVWYWHIKKCLSQTDVKKKKCWAVYVITYTYILRSRSWVTDVRLWCVGSAVRVYMGFPKDIPQQPPPSPIILSVSPETWPLRGLCCIAIVYWIYYIYAVYILHSNTTLQCVCVRTTWNIYVYIIVV